MPGLGRLSTALGSRKRRRVRVVRLLPGTPLVASRRKTPVATRPLRPPRRPQLHLGPRTVGRRESPGRRDAAPPTIHGEPSGSVMTTVVVWVGVDSRGPASAYVATDSRFSWRSGHLTETWDRGRKTFSSDKFPDVAGYWGDVLFPIVTLSQFFANLDAGVVVTPYSSSAARFGALEEALRLSLATVPVGQRRAFTVVHVARDGESMTSSFSIRTLSWSQATEWSREVLQVPNISSAIRLGGSGAGVRSFTWPPGISWAREARAALSTARSWTACSRPAIRSQGARHS